MRGIGLQNIISKYQHHLFMAQALKATVIEKQWQFIDFLQFH
jgi:hypothetical protein